MKTRRYRLKYTLYEKKVEKKKIKHKEEALIPYVCVVCKIDFVILD